MKNKISLSVLFMLTAVVLLSACADTSDDKGAAKDETGNDEKYEEISEYDKLMQNAEKELSRDKLEEAKEIYIEAKEHDGDDNLDTKIKNLEAFIPLVDDALFDYLITVGDKKYQVLIHAEDYDHTIVSLDDGTVRACADEGEEVYKGDYSIYARERSQTKFTNHFLGSTFINENRNPVQTIEYEDGNLLLLSECETSNSSEMKLYSFVDDEIEQVSFNNNYLEDYDNINLSFNMIKDYNPSKNKFQSIFYNKTDEKYSVYNLTYNVDANVMMIDEIFQLDDVEDSIDEWTDQKGDFHFDE